MALECCRSVIPAGLTSFNKIGQENSWPASGGSCVCLGVHLRACGCAGALCVRACALSRLRAAYVQVKDPSRGSVEHFGSSEPHVLGPVGGWATLSWLHVPHVQTIGDSPQPLLSRQFTPFSA